MKSFHSQLYPDWSTCLGFLLLIFIILSPETGSGQKTTALSEARSKTLDQLRTFRDSLQTCADKKECIKLTEKLATLISVSKNMSDIVELQRITNYFMLSRKTISGLTEDQKLAALSFLDNDIALKAEDVDDPSLGIESLTTFGKSKNIKVDALISGQRIEGGTYRLYWGRYLGGNPEVMIKSNSSAGSSSTYVNPYDLQVLVPGYICFWLIDEQTKKIYKTSFTHQILTRESDKLSINFLESK